MIKVVGVRFKKAGKIYYFNPNNFEVTKDVPVIVETSRGLEYGVVQSDIKEVTEEKIITPLKNIVRIADEKDTEKHIENMEKKESAIKLCKSKIIDNNLEMKLVDVEYTFDDAKIIFYFTADGRVDFRELVKDLASIFKMRIELRQIGVRDEAKSLGGVGNCGRCLCCNSWLQDFNPVSIKMAKSQNLPLNPTKISGICGRLMCCLKYENDVYKELRKGMPDIGEKIKTSDGYGTVIETNTLTGKIKVRLIEGQKDEENNLSDEIYEYLKEDIKRIEKRKHIEKKEDLLNDLDCETIKELKSIMKE